MAGKSTYTSEEREKVARAAYLLGPPGCRLMATKHKTSWTTVRRWQIEFGFVSPDADVAVPSPNAIPPVFQDLKVSEMDWRDALGAIRAVQAVVRAADNGQSEARVSIDADEPIVLCPTADWHLGSLAVDYDAFEHNIDFVLGTPHLYLLSVGDDIDNFTGFRSVAAVLGQGVPPKVQKRMLGGIMDELLAAGKLVARTWGNHDADFDDRVFGGAIEAFNDRVPWLKDDGRLYLTVGGAEYNVYAKHTFPGYSYLNVNHGAKRAVRMDWPDADLLISGHTHNGPEMDHFLHDGRIRLAMKVPTVKTSDTYSKRWFGRSVSGLQGIVLFPREKRWVAFHHAEDAVLYRDAVARTLALPA